MGELFITNVRHNSLPQRPDRLFLANGQAVGSTENEPGLHRQTQDISLLKIQSFNPIRMYRVCVCGGGWVGGGWVGVCVCACVRACVRVSACVCVCV